MLIWQVIIEESYECNIFIEMHFVHEKQLLKFPQTFQAIVIFIIRTLTN